MNTWYAQHTGYAERYATRSQFTHSSHFPPTGRVSHRYYNKVPPTRPRTGRPEATVTSISHVAQKRRHEPPPRLSPARTPPHDTSRATVRYTLTTLHGPHTSIRPTRSKYKDALTGDAYCTGRYLYSSSSGGTGLARQALPPAGMRLHGGSESMGGTGFSSFVLYILARCSRYTSAYSFSTLACRRSK